MRISVRTQGQTFIEVLMLITLVAILATVSISVMTDTAAETRFAETKSKLTAIRKALVGDPSLIEGGMRSSFGYLGEVGSLPTVPQGLAALWTLPGGVAAFSTDATTRIGAGWNGPYLNHSNSGLDYSVDGWGNAFIYAPAANPPTLTSYGADGIAGGTGFNQDITMELPLNLTSAAVFGVILNGGSQWSGSADLELYQPDGNGSLQTLSASILAADNGAFSFSGVSLGVRSVKIYISSKASPTQTLGPIVFSVTGHEYMIPSKMIDLTH